MKRLRPFVWTSPIHETVRLTPVVYDSDIEILHRPVSDHSRRDFSTYIKAFARGNTVGGLCYNYVMQGALYFWFR